MSNFRVTRFNALADNTPVNFENNEEFWKQVKMQAEQILEEAKEMMEGAEERDIIKLLDGQVDVWYTNEYMDDLLSTTGIDVKEARNLVCDNNDNKFTRNYQFALESAAIHTDNGMPTRVSKSVWQGVDYYGLRRIADGKIMKMKDHQAPDLKQVFTREALEYFGIEGE